jgi:tetratricopeptide (TPR) repeat protein
MGEVYLAEQTEPVRRRVALKMIRLGMDTQEIVARFESERQALAVMDHPHIAKVFDAGVSDTHRPYFVMELVQGVPFTEYADTHKLATRERLQLFIGICEAVQHAHQKGVIHRDLKPSNVLVGVQEGKAVPKVIDFGIAKAMGRRLTDQTFVTVQGIPIGTPAYMSPEQAEMSGLDVDTRTDIYTLGVMLYELLAGSLPFDPKEFGADFITFQVKLRESDPPKPSTRIGNLGEEGVAIAELRKANAVGLRGQLKGDLDWIIMKALEKDRTRRYETVNGLIQDIRRHLNDEPVTARAPTPAYRVGKFVKRHKVWVAAATLAVFSLGAGLVVATYQRQQAVMAQERALHNLNLAIEAVDEMLLRVGDTLAAVPQMEQFRGALLDKARQFYEQFQEQTTEPELRLGSALAHQRLGDVYRFLAQNDKAEGAYGDAIDRLTELSAEYPDDPRYQHHLADTYNWLGLQLASVDGARAMEAYGRAFDLQQDLVGRLPDAFEYRHHLARTLYNRGILLSADTTGSAHAERDYRAAIAHLESLIAENRSPTAPTADYQQELARSYNNLGFLMRLMGQETEAVEYYGSAVDILEDLRRGDADGRAYKQELAIYYNNLANLSLDNGDLESAESRNRRALELFEDLAAPLPSLDLERANSYNTLGMVFLDRNLSSEANEALQSSLEIWERLERNSQQFVDDPVFHYRFGFTLFDLAMLRFESGDVVQAALFLERAAEHHATVVEHVESGNAMLDLCFEYQDLAEMASGWSRRAGAGRATDAIAVMVEKCQR